MNKVFKWLGGGILVVGVLSAIAGKSNHPRESVKPIASSALQVNAPAASPPPQFDPQSIKLVKEVMFDDLKVWSHGGGNAMEGVWHAQNIGSPLKVTAVDLSRKYDANEVAADNEYKGKTLWITGTVTAISKNAFNQPYLSLRGAEMFHDVQASMDSSAQDQIATFRKGQKVSLICKGAGMIVLSPMATQCITLDTAMDQAALKEADWIDSFFAGKADGSDDLKRSVAVLYIEAVGMPADSACYTSINSKACLRDVDNVVENVQKDPAKRAEWKSQYASMQAYLKLPPPTSVKAEQVSTVQGQR